MQNKVLLDNSLLFSTQLCSKARNPGQHRGGNVLGGTHSSISPQARTELLEERKQQESSCTHRSGRAWQHFLRDAQHPQELRQTQISLWGPPSRSCSCPMEQQKLPTADHSPSGIQQEELDRPFPRKMSENHWFEPCHISFATMTFR